MKTYYLIIPVFLCRGLQGHPLTANNETRYEKDMSVSCTQDEVLCSALGSGDTFRCVEKTSLCDGRNDCPAQDSVTLEPFSTGVDENERFCTKKCTEKNEIQCPRDGICISKDKVCDGKPDCPDDWDEHVCCGPLGFSCENNICVSNGMRCDGIKHCKNGLDESPKAGCDCDQHTEFTCTDQKKCVKLSEKCNKISDCPDSSDEEECHFCDEETEFTCTTGLPICIPKMRVCDRARDCLDASDEEYCPSDQSCQINKFVKRKPDVLHSNVATVKECQYLCKEGCCEYFIYVTKKPNEFANQFDCNLYQTVPRDLEDASSSEMYTISGYQNCYIGPDGGKGKFPTNSTPLFTFETPYKKVDTSRAVADMFTDAIEAEGKEDVFDLNSSGLIRNTQAGTINIANIITWPFLQGKGVSIVSIKVPSCSTGIPHFHTNHDELNYIITGSNLTVGIKENLKPLNLMKNVKAGNVVLAPQGSIHFFINLSCTKVAEVIQIYPTELSTTTTIASNIVSFPSEIFATAFNTDIDLNEALKETQLQEVEYLRLDSYCLKRCGLLQAF